MNLMNPAFSFSRARISLEHTPAVLSALLRPLPADLLNVNEGPGTWSPMEVVRHLAWGECDDWIPRVRRILDQDGNRAFAPFDREHGNVRYAGWSIHEVLDEFARLRAESLAEIDRLAVTPDLLAREGRHPEFGPVTLEQLLATWVTHDCAHLAQMARVLTRHYGAFVGPWRKYFSLLETAEP